MGVGRITDIWAGFLSGAEGRVSITFVSLCRETRTTVPSTSPLGPITPPHDGISLLDIWSPATPAYTTTPALLYSLLIITRVYKFITRHVMLAVLPDRGF